MPGDFMFFFHLFSSRFFWGGGKLISDTRADLWFYHLICRFVGYILYELSSVSVVIWHIANVPRKLKPFSKPWDAS